MSYLPLNSVRNITNATAKSGGLAFDGVTDCKVLHAAASVGTSDFTVAGTFLFPASLPATGSTIIGLTSSTSNLNTPYALAIAVDQSNGFTIIFFGSSTSVFRKRYLASTLADYAGKIVHYAVVRSVSGASLTVYLNGVAQTMSSSDTATPPSFADTIDSTYVIQGRYTTSYYCNTSIFGAQVFNRALSASEVVTLANQGVQESDKWGSLTPGISGSTLNGDFEASPGSVTAPWVTRQASNWIATDLGGTGSTFEAATDSVHGGTYSCKITSAASSALWQIYQNGVTGAAGKNYRLTFWARSDAPSAFVVNQVTTPVLYTVNTTTTWQPFSFVFTAASAGGIRFQPAGTGQTNSRIFWIDDVVLERVGAILDADLFAGVGYQVPDRSSNNYHGLVSTSGTSWTLPVKNYKAIFTASSSGYLGDATNRVVIPSNARINSITAYSASGSTFSLGDDSGASTNLVSSVSVSAATLTYLTLLKRYATTSTAGRLYVAFSAANSTTFTIDYSITATS